MKEATKRYLGIDWGKSRIGLAMGDDISKLASPLGVVSDISEITALIDKEGIVKIVLGEPIKMSGCRAATEWQRFYRKLKDKVNVPIILADERLSSRAADKLPGSKKTKAGRDAVAAQLILQNYFDKD